MPTTKEVLKKYSSKVVGRVLEHLVDGWVEKAKEKPILASEMLLRIRLVQAFVNKKE